MAERLKGEVVISRESGDLTLVYNFDALCRMEDALDMGVAVIGAKLSKDPRLNLVRTVFHAGLQEHHPEITHKEAGELIMELGDRVGPAIGEALAAAFPQPGEGGEAAPRPQRSPRAA